MSGRESWLGLMWKLEALRRRAAVFAWSYATATLSEGGSEARKSGGRHASYSAAASKTVMRARRHYAQFTVIHRQHVLQRI